MKTILYYVLCAVAFVVVLRDPNAVGPDPDAYDAPAHLRRTLEAARDVMPYGQAEIEAASPFLHSFAPRLLVFDGEFFQVYNIKSNKTTYHEVHDFGNRPVMIVPLLVHTLKTQFPNRFEKGQSPFQVLFTDADSLRTDCVNGDMDCETEKWPPILVFGSLMKDAARSFPSAQVMPVPPYCECLYKFLIRGETVCEWVDTKSIPRVPVETLKPTIIWRGSDYAFLFQYEKFRFKDSWDVFGKDVGNLTKEDVAVKVFQNWNDIGPRWRGTALSIQAEIEHRHAEDPIWLDSRFAGDMPGMSPKTLEHFQKIGVHVKGNSMSPNEMALHRYQIDYGGGGGTTWSGTLSKLAMPGILFHHETPTMDWFHSEMEPWRHYIPVNWDLTDLRAKYDWAEANLDKVQRISNEATKLSEYLLSTKYMRRTYQEFFVNYMKKAVKAYNNGDAGSWTEAKARYESKGFKLQPLATCNHVQCTVRAEKQKSDTSSRVLRYIKQAEQ